MENRVGKLLIATPTMPAENFFAKTVVYIYADDDRGTTGVILNKESNTTVQDLCYDHKINYPNSSPKVYIGGPVNKSAMVLLHTDDWQSQNTALAGKNLLVSSDKIMMLKMSEGNEPIYWRMIVGLSVWAPGQLDMEIKGQFPYNEAHEWLTVDPTEDILFEYDGEEQWNKALELYSQQMIDYYF
jgi:putative transcriptional regulator